MRNLNKHSLRLQRARRLIILVYHEISSFHDIPGLSNSIYPSYLCSILISVWQVQAAQWRPGACMPGGRCSKPDELNFCTSKRPHNLY
jgi:hypothetical protein